MWYVERILSQCGSVYVISIDINGNRLNLIPEGLSRLGGIRTMYANNNLVEILPESFIRTFAFLRILNLSDNALRRLPDNLGDLKLLSEFRVSNNKLSWLPKSMETLKCLQDFHCKRNAGLRDFQVEITYNRSKAKKFLSEYFQFYSCRQVALLVMLICRQEFAFVGKDVIVLIGKAIYATRKDPAWETPPVVPLTRKKTLTGIRERKKNLTKENSQKCVIV
jgi:hypothetical protein